MTLTTSLDITRSGLSVTSDQTSVVSRNVANADDPYASRKIANVVTAPGGGARVASITRMANPALLENMLSATSESSQQQTIVDALDHLHRTVNDPELDISPAAMLGKLSNSLQLFASAPHDAVRGQSAVVSAVDMAASLNNATQTVQQLRQQADQDIANSVGNLNTLLSQFGELNTFIVNGTRAGADVTDALDSRDRLLGRISEEIGITVLRRSDNDMAVFTDSGVTIFEHTARTVSFQTTAFFAPGVSGNSVYIDGVPVTDTSLGGGLNSGRLKGLSAVRDDATVVYQNQLDEIARGLIEAFSESDQSAVPTLATQPGLFTYDGAPAMPTPGVLTSGLAASIRVNPNADPSQGGNVSLLRDGGISDPGNAAYQYNTTGAAGFSDRLNGLVDQFSVELSFDAATEADTSATLSSFASSSAAWLEQSRSSASSEASYRLIVVERSIEALSSANGVSLDAEMTALLDLERSYAASTKLITTIDSMFDSLLAAVR